VPFASIFFGSVEPLLQSDELLRNNKPTDRLLAQMAGRLEPFSNHSTAQGYSFLESPSPFSNAMAYCDGDADSCSRSNIRLTYFHSITNLHKQYMLATNVC